MRIVKGIAMLGLLAMTVVLIYGFTAFSCWVVYRERSLVRGAVWVILMMVLGFFTASLYILIALHTSGGNWNRFWKGNRA